MLRSLFILPGTYPFVNATGTRPQRSAPPQLGSEAGLFHRQLDVHPNCGGQGRSRIRFSLLMLPPQPLPSCHALLAGESTVEQQSCQFSRLEFSIRSAILRPRNPYTPCRPSRHRGSVPTGGHHGIYIANGATAIPADRLGSRNRSISVPATSAQSPREPRRRSNLSRCR